MPNQPPEKVRKRALSPGVMQPQHEADRSPTYAPSLKISRTVLPLSHMPSLDAQGQHHFSLCFCISRLPLLKALILCNFVLY